MAAKNGSKEVKVKFQHSKDTKGTYVFSEVGDDGKDALNPAIGTLYVKKHIIGHECPKELNVTIHL